MSVTEIIDHLLLQNAVVTKPNVLCGNGAVDDGEDCDCGPVGDVISMQ